MGDYSKDLLRLSIKRGIPISSNPRKRKLVNCPNCHKPCRGKAGVMQHQNAKHNENHTWNLICAQENEYE